MDLSLIGKQALVCGSTQGIGKATAIELATLGANVTLVARNEDRLKTTIAELDRSQEQQHDYVVADFSQPDILQSQLESYMQHKKAVHILVNNSGGPPPGKAEEASVDDFLEAFRIHLVCNQHLVQAVIPSMKHIGYGRIVNVISTSVKVPIPGLGVSNTIRGAVASWAKTLAHELGSFGITVNNVLPGFTTTPRLESLIVSRAQNAGISPEAQAKNMKANVPAQRFASPDEIANAIAFLASPSASYINGINLPVDGGNTPTL